MSGLRVYSRRIGLSFNKLALDMLWVEMESNANCGGWLRGKDM